MSYFILTDTSANLPTPVCEEWELERMPFAYILDGKEYTCMDTENFDDKEYYGKLRSGVRATTSMVAQEAYYEAMTRRAANGDDVLYIGMSSGISGAYAASESASKRVREENPNVRIETFDTRGASLGEGLLVLEAARMRKAGASMDEVLAMLRNYRSRMQQVFTVDDLMHLQRGGRVSRVTAMVGSVLQIKPILESDELGRIIEDQIARSTDAIVICGTTGECSTMTDEEQLAAIKYTVDLVSHRVPVIAGAGSNDTDHGCALAAKSAACGADALLLVTPYYNKTSQAGLVAHFTAMAEAGGIPVILYNVPSRTGLNIAPETAKELSRHPLINGIKEASGNIGQVAKIAALCGDELNIYSGNDDQVVPLLSLGGKGVISVVSNVKPELVHNCCKAWFDGDTAKARELQLEMLPLCDALFCEVNPIPVKYAMNVLGWEAGECRLPLVEPGDAHKEQIEQALQAAGLIKE